MKKIFILILFFILSLSITSKIEAWGYVQDLNNNYWVDTGDKKSCEGRVLNDSLSSTKKCEEYNPRNSPNDYYYFNETQSDGTKKTHSFLGINLCILARNNLIKETPIMLQSNISECAILDLNNNTDVYTFKPETESGSKTPSSTYTLLAPIGGLETAPDNIGDYFNTMFEIIIGICAVLAVVMIVLGGIQYMGNESVFGKTEAKSQIWRAILGLLIALASFALLNTIDPNLLGRGGLNIKQVSAEIEEPPILSDEGKTIPTKNNFTDCPGGVRTVNTATVQFIFCSAYASKLQGLISAAQTDGIKLSGGSFRTYEEQIQARKNNRCPDVFTSPSSSCRPPTAIPGTSLHEQGLAVDFRCNGNSMEGSGGRNSPCFKWLSKNAASYGFKNFYKESWHWSTGPRAGS